MAASRLITTCAVFVALCSPALADKACVIIYANDMGAKITKEIRDHEYAHCNGWTHEHGFDKSRGFEKAYIPPKSFLRHFPGKVWEHSLSTKDVRASCSGMLGCSDILTD